MKVETYVKKNNVKEFFLQSKGVVALMHSDNFANMNNFGHFKIKRIEEVEGELVTLHI